MSGRQLKIGQDVLTIYPGDGILNDGKKIVETVKIGHEDAPHFQLEHEVHWDSDEELQNAIRDTLEIKEGWPNTGDAEWTEHELLNPDTQLWELVEFAVMNPYFTSDDVKDHLDLNGNTQNVIYKAKKRNLIAVVGRDGNYHVLAPTHLAYKELFIEYDMDFLQRALHIDMEHNEEHEEHENPQSLSDFGI